MDRCFGPRLAQAVGVCCLFLASLAPAQEPGTAPADDRSAAAQTAAGAPHGSAGPVAVPEPTERAMHFYRTGNVVWVVDNMVGLLVPALFLFTGFSALLRDGARRVGRKWYFTFVIYFALFSVISWAVTLPWAYYVQFVRLHAFDLSNQTLARWLTHSLRELAIGIVVGALFLWIPLVFIERSPRRWWLYTAAVSVPFLVLMLLVSPIWIDPLFNKFGPMKDKALETQILALADTAGIEGGRVFEVDKSVDTKAVNAYVSGFGQTKRIVLWDTIIAKLDRRELLFVMGHEMGHYVLGHIPKMIGTMALVLLMMLYLAHRSARLVIARWQRRFGFDALHDIAALPLLMILAGVFSLVVTPAFLAVSRHQEHQADRFGLEITRDNHAAATAFVKLQTENLSNPRPGLLFKLWRSSHPPLGERIEFCNSYRPWEKDEPLAYEDRFRGSPSTR